MYQHTVMTGIYSGKPLNANKAQISFHLFLRRHSLHPVTTRSGSSLTRLPDSVIVAPTPRIALVHMAIRLFLEDLIAQATVQA